jgi:hypothetical protein
MEINNLLEDARGGYKSMQADSDKLASKWQQSGLLEGLNEKKAGNMAVILENQAKQIVAEANTNTQGGAGFTAGSGENWAGVALPLVRKVFAQIVAQDFVSVQPMSLPSGLVFYLDFKYGDGHSGRADGENLYGNVTEGGTKMAKDTDPSGGLYGAGKFGYTINDISSSITATTASATSASLAYNADLDPADFIKVTQDFTGLNADLLGARAFRINSASVDITNYPELTTVAGTEVTFVILRTDVANVSHLAASLVSNYAKQPLDNDRGDFEAAGDRAVENLNIPEIDVKLSSEAIVAKTRKLKAQWTPEFAQDLNAYHSIDAEAELTSLLSEYISMEIDLEILDMLILEANTTERWSAENNKVWTGTGWSASATSDFYNTQGQWFQTLGTKVQKVSNKIHQKTLRGGANFLVCSPSVATILESIPGYAAATNGDQDQFAMGVQKVGALNNRFQVYKNPYMTENVILMGYRGSQFLEAGAVYAPYVPLMMTPLVYDPESFTPRKGLMTRYAKKMIRPEFYAKIFVSDIDSI